MARSWLPLVCTPVCGYEHVELGIVRARNVQLPRMVAKTITRGSGDRSKGMATQKVSGKKRQLAVCESGALGGPHRR